MRFFFGVFTCVFALSFATYRTNAQQVYNPALWTERVDKTWGEGRPTAEKLALFDTVWNIANRYFPYFVTKPPINWDSLRTRFRPEIARGISQGKFLAYMSRLVYHLNDAHAGFTDLLLNNGNGSIYTTMYGSRAPIFAVRPFETLGICTTTLADGSAMVYDADTLNPLKLRPGDIIWGYNGTPWRDLIPTLLNSDLPIVGSAGSTIEHQRNSLLAAGISNWHLFDSIHIIRAGQTTITTLPTSLMQNWYNSRMLCREGLPISGVPQLSWSSFYNQRNEASYGKITGTNIGYIYAHRCLDSLPQQFYNAVVELTQRTPSDALIIDLRRNDGGYINAFGPGWSQLYNESIKWLSYAIRDTNKPNERNAMVWLEQRESGYEQALTTANEGYYRWYRYQPKFFNKPIAVLSGPGSVSAGDMFVHVMRYHPRARIFGRPSNGAFGANTPWRISNDTLNIRFTMPNVNFYDVRTKTLLGGRTYPIDEEVWLTRKNVTAGYDDVVEAAVRWIGANSAQAVASVATSRVYPNPFIEELSVRLNIARTSEKVQIRLSTVLQKELTSFEETLPQGEHTIVLRAPNLARGVYVVSIQTQGKRELIRVIRN